jgi:ABC-2 type transport system permease protein
MKDFITLLKVQLNTNFGLSALRYRFRSEPEKTGQTVAMIVAITFSVGMLVVLYSLLMGAIYAAGAMVGMPDLALITAILGLQLFLLVTGIFYVLGVFFYSRDMTALMPLPVRPWQVLGSKFAVVLAYEYLMALPVLLPPMLIYGIGQAAGVFYWLKAIVIILVSPALPLMVASLLAIVMMRFLNVGRRKDLLAMLGGFVGIALILAVNLLSQRFAGSAASGDFTRLLADQAALVNALGRAFPPSAWATLALSAGGWGSWGYLLLFVALSAALLALMFWLANLTYYKSAMRSEETATRRRAAGKAVVDSGGAGGPVKALYLKEMRLLLRTPAFAMNCLLGTLIIPVIMPLSLLQNKESSTGIADLISNPANSMIVTLAAVGLMMFAAVVNVTASTSLSREGSTFWMSRMIPVPPAMQVRAKFLTAMSVAGAGIALTAVMLVALLHFSLLQTLTAVALGALGAMPVTIVNMLPDFLKPKLAWTNPYEAVKQNMNVLLAMLGAVVLVGAEVVLTLVIAVLGLGEWGVYAVLAVVQAALAFAGLKALDAVSCRYYKIEA